MKARQKKRAVSSSWRMDETYIKIKGEWWYYYRAVDKSGDIVDFYLSKERDENAARAFLRKAIGNKGLPYKVVIDKSGALALHHINTLLWFSGVLMLSKVTIQKQKMVQALGWKSEAGALATMAGQETWTMIITRADYGR